MLDLFSFFFVLFYYKTSWSDLFKTILFVLCIVISLISKWKCHLLYILNQNRIRRDINLFFRRVVLFSKGKILYFLTLSLFVLWKNQKKMWLFWCLIFRDKANCTNQIYIFFKIYSYIPWNIPNLVKNLSEISKKNKSTWVPDKSLF